MLDKPQILKYLDDVRSSYEAYHNHKENTAWAALALYMVVIIQVAGTLSPNADQVERVGRAAVLILLGIVLNVFIGTQLKLCRRGGEYASASLALYTEYLTKDCTAIQEDDFKINNPSESEFQASFTVARIVEEKRQEFESRVGGNRLLLGGLKIQVQRVNDTAAV